MFRHALLASLCALVVLPAAALGHGQLAAVTHADTPSELSKASIVRALSTAGDTPTGVPSTWCGTKSTSDDLADAAAPASPVVKVVYAYANDRADRFDTWKDLLQGNVSTIGRFLATQSGGGKSVRFDMGTTCGADYLDITVVPLPKPRASYVGDANFNTLSADVAGALGVSAVPRDVLIMADGFSDGGIYGLGEVIPTEDRPGSDNAHNAGDFTAAIYSPMDYTPSTTGGWQPTMMLHEISHNLGAVQASAVHSTPRGHCWDGLDVMCYDDGSSGSQLYTASACPSVPGAISQTYDCGRDDYYDPAPAAGSYLASHWNLYRSAFMAPCTSLGKACAGLGRVLTPPVSVTSPRVVGLAQAGQVVTTDHGTWLNAPSSYSVTWQHQIAGGAWQDMLPRGEVWSIGLGDVGTPLRAVVTATNGDGSAVAASDPVVPVAAPGAAAAPARAQTGSPPGSGPLLTASPVTSTLRIALRGGTRVAGVVPVRVRRAVTGVTVSSAAVAPRARPGSWRLKLCASASGQARRCALGSRTRARSGRVSLRAVRVTLRSTAKAVTVTAALVDSRARSTARGSAIAR